MGRRWQLLLTLAVLTLASCRAPRMEVLPYEATEVKTEYVNRYVRDTTYITEREVVEPRNDTVYITRTSVQYKERVSYRDSVRVDSIPVEYLVEVPVEIERPLTRWQRFKMDVGGWGVTVAVLLLVGMLAKYILHIYKR